MCEPSCHLYVVRTRLNSTQPDSSSGFFHDGFNGLFGRDDGFITECGVDEEHQTCFAELLRDGESFFGPELLIKRLLQVNLGARATVAGDPLRRDSVHDAISVPAFT